MAETAMPLPWWISVLDASEKWGKAPWEILGKPENRLLWMLRFTIFNQIVEQAQTEKGKHK